MMFFQYGTEEKETQTAEEESQCWAKPLETYLTPYSERLDAYLDRRVVGNLTATVAAIVQTRERVDDERSGKWDLWARACGGGHPTAPTSTAPSGVGVGGDRRGAVGPGGEESTGDGTARRNAVM